MGPIVKRVLDVLEWSYVVPEKPFWGSLVRGDPPTRFGESPDFSAFFFVKPSLSSREMG